MKEFVAPAGPSQWPTDGTLFLAGGITGCPDWQAEAVEQLRDTRGVVLNPRRPDFPIDDPDAAVEQIEWEYIWLNRAAVLLFWFCAEQVQPIALYELGRYASRPRVRHSVVVGVDPGYPRAVDVRVQLRLARPELGAVHQTLDSTVRAASSLVRA